MNIIQDSLFFCSAISKEIHNFSLDLLREMDCLRVLLWSWSVYYEKMSHAPVANLGLCKGVLIVNSQVVFVKEIGLNYTVSGDLLIFQDPL